MSLNIKGIREFSSFISANKTQLRNEGNIKLHDYFHNDIIKLVDEPYYPAIVKFLSKAYRGRMDISRVIIYLNEAMEEARRQSTKDAKEMKLDIEVDTEDAPKFSAPESPVVNRPAVQKPNSPSISVGSSDTEKVKKVKPTPKPRVKKIVIESPSSDTEQSSTSSNVSPVKVVAKPKIVRPKLIKK